VAQGAAGWPNQAGNTYWGGAATVFPGTLPLATQTAELQGLTDYLTQGPTGPLSTGNWSRNQGFVNRNPNVGATNAGIENTQQITWGQPGPVWHPGGGNLPNNNMEILALEGGIQNLNNYLAALKAQMAIQAPPTLGLQ